MDTVIVGLGNPGAEYEATRHNVGFMIVDRLVQRCQGRWKKQGAARVARVCLHDVSFWCIKPETFMNLSGNAVRGFLSREAPKQLIIVHDELDLEVGILRLKCGGGTGGHNGLKSLKEQLGPLMEQAWRLRFGIGHPGSKSLVSDYVLSAFVRDEQVLKAETIERAVDTLGEMLVTTDYARIVGALHAPQKE